MSTLFVNTIYPDSGSSVNISGSLVISQSLIVADNITMSGSIKLGAALPPITVPFSSSFHSPYLSIFKYIYVNATPGAISFKAAVFTFYLDIN